MSTEEIEKYAKNLKHPKLVDFCVEMSNYVRRLEQQAELREEFLKRSQTQVEGRDKAIDEKDNKIGQLEKELQSEKELNLAQKINKDIEMPEKETGANTGSDELIDSNTDDSTGKGR